MNRGGRMDHEVMEIADKVELCGNTIDTVIGWLMEEMASDSAIDELTDVMETLLGAAPRLREIAGAE